MFSFLGKTNPLSNIHSETQSNFNNLYPKNNALSTAQTTEFACKKFIEEKKLSDNLWSGFTNTGSVTARAQNLASWSFLKLGQILTMAPSGKTILANDLKARTTLMNTHYIKSSEKEKIDPIKLEFYRLHKEGAKGTFGAQLQLAENSLSENENGLNEKTTEVSMAAKAAAKKTHEFQRNVGFYTTISIGAVGLAAKLAPLAFGNKHN